MSPFFFLYFVHACKSSPTTHFLVQLSRARLLPTPCDREMCVFHSPGVTSDAMSLRLCPLIFVRVLRYVWQMSKDEVAVAQSSKRLGFELKVWPM